MIFTTFYTKNSPYEISVKKLQEDLLSYGYEIFIQCFPENSFWVETYGKLGNFIVDVMNRYNDDVIWIDADAEVFKKPEELFNIPLEADIAVYCNNDHFLLGTMLFRNRPHVKKFLKEWSKSVSTSSNTISKMIFKRLIASHPEIKIHPLPQRLCQIYDFPITEEPVILHKQFSKLRKIDGKVKKLEERKRILLPVILDGWAFNVRCNALQKFLSHEYIFNIVSNEEIKHNVDDIDLVYFCTYEAILKRGHFFKNICASVAGLVINDLKNSMKYFGKAKAIAVLNQEWFRQYNDLNIKQKLFYIPNSVDPKIFKKEKKEEREFTIGWVGNSLPYRENIKRSNILRETCKRLGIKFMEQNFKNKQISHEMMPKFYNNIDLYINISTTEGSNNCILEAMSCEVPIAGTPVGNVPELIKDGIFVIKQDLSNLEEVILKIKAIKREEREKIGKQLRFAIWNNYSWFYGAKRFKQMFDYCLE